MIAFWGRIDSLLAADAIRLLVGRSTSHLQMGASLSLVGHKVKLEAVRSHTA